MNHMPVTKSILRYPGGKTQLASFVNHLIEINGVEDPVYCEPFCGGAGIAMELLLAGKVKSVVLNDLDPAIYSIWYAVIHDTERFIDKIQDTPIDMEEWHRQRDVYQSLKDAHGYSFELGYAAFFLNRTNRSGIIQGGPIGGYKQTSKYALNCRFNVENLVKKTRSIAKYKNQIHLYSVDGLEFIKHVLPTYNQDNLFVYFDPPYYNQGQFLYRNGLTDKYHVELASVIQRLQYKWIVTYDHMPRIQELYQRSRQFLYALNYSANRKRKEHELLFTNDKTVVESFGTVSLVSAINERI